MTAVLWLYAACGSMFIGNYAEICHLCQGKIQKKMFVLICPLQYALQNATAQ